MKEDLWWKTTFDEIWPLMEGGLWWKMTFELRQPLMEDDILWKTTLDGRLPSMGDDLQPLIEDNLWGSQNLIQKKNE